MIRNLLSTCGAVVCFMFCTHFLSAADVVSEPLCVAEISPYSSGKVSPPSRQTDYWSSSGSGSLSNGLFFSIPTKYWVHQSQAEEEVQEISSGLKGKASLHYGWNHTFRYPNRRITNREYFDEYRKLFHETHFKLKTEKQPWGIPINLSCSTSSSFDHLPKIAEIKEDVQIAEGWLWNETKYYYLVKLSDGTSWLSKELRYPWQEHQQFIGMRVIVIGTNEEACLIRITPKEYENITPANCFINMHRVE